MTGTCAACLHSNQSRSYLDHLVIYIYIFKQGVTEWTRFIWTMTETSEYNVPSRFTQRREMSWPMRLSLEIRFVVSFRLRIK
jgi:hypothetical protein